MLDLQPATARRPGPSHRRFGLALAGGGPLGAFYEVGCLHAIEEALDGFGLTELEMYVGVSSGAMIAAGLANGFDTADMGLVFIHNESSELRFSPAWFLVPAAGEYMRRLAGAPGLLAGIAYEFLKDPGRDWAEVIDPLGRLLPTGVCDNRPLERLLARLFTQGGRTNDFRQLVPRLYVMATELNTGHPVRFGEPGFDHVPISRAIQASTALPGLYPPVTIDGRVYADGALVKTMHASVLLDAGADFVICVNPLVAFDASSAPRPPDGYPPQEHELTTGGLPTVLSQTFRSLIQSRMRVGMRDYRRRYPRADVLMFEPVRGDARLFFQNVFRYADREGLAEHAYQRTRQDLRRHATALQKMLQRHDVRLRLEVLHDRSRTFAQAVEQRKRRQLPLVGPLHAALDRLEHAVPL
ncbi:MAG TPA: patatin-like phospholipase family protein, partial [Steroidobacteraceae bacterium]|nr:patatin-like phospholipase family protein [Steroidobacteraceae bacterium]